MTQSDKDFITRIQVSQLVTQDPYADDFYAQVYGAILRSRMGLPTSEDRVLKFGSGGGVGLGLGQKMPNRRQNAMQRMEAQVERIVNNARLREKEKTCTCTARGGVRKLAELFASAQQPSGCTGQDSWPQLQSGSSPVAPGRLEQRVYVAHVVSCTRGAYFEDRCYED